MKNIVLQSEQTLCSQLSFFLKSAILCLNPFSPRSTQGVVWSMLRLYVSFSKKSQKCGGDQK